GGEPEGALPAAVAVELVHNASLIHDDIMDGDTTRRHLPTVWARHGVPNAILAGDALFALAFEALTAQRDREDPEAESRVSAAVDHLARTLRHLMAGQSHDMRFQGQSSPSLSACLEMIEGKTGVLLGCACRLGALSAAAPDSWVDGFERFGVHLGVAFQLIDDMLGIWGDPVVTGKPVGSDLRSRKKSAPIVAALVGGGPASARLAELYHSPDPFTEPELTLAAELVEEAGGRSWARGEAARRVEESWNCLAGVDMPDHARQDLQDLTNALLNRKH
ncbi:polyprenyl synthetase family protein, partial [Streptosporangium algeriense]